jgi:hypothetical protein
MRGRVRPRDGPAQLCEETPPPTSSAAKKIATASDMFCPADRQCNMSCPASPPQRPKSFRKAKRRREADKIPSFRPEKKELPIPMPADPRAKTPPSMHPAVDWFCLFAPKNKSRPLFPFLAKGQIEKLLAVGQVVESNPARRLGPPPLYAPEEVRTVEWGGGEENHQSLSISKAQSNCRWVFLSSSTKLELTEYLSRTAQPEGAVSSWT